jgi:hypothetical protein
VGDIDYAAWRFNIFCEHGGLTYRDIDRLTADRTLRPGMTYAQVVDALSAATDADERGESQSAIAAQRGVPAATDDQLSGALRWHALARVVGYNELAKDAQTLGEKVYLRLARDEARKDYERLGGEIQDTGPEPVIVVNTRPPFVVMSDADIELMREAVAAHDAQRGGR